MRTFHMCTRNPTDIFGLKWEPSDAKFNIPQECQAKEGAWHFDDETVRAFKENFEMSKPQRAILEIGLGNNRREDQAGISSTALIQANKTPGAIYLGLDILQEAMVYHNPAKQNYVGIVNSHDFNYVRAFMGEHDISQWDFIFIDGQHTLYDVSNDWKYVEDLKIGGVVGLHDTGTMEPAALFEAISEEYFNKRIYGVPNTQYENAIAFCTRIK